MVREAMASSVLRYFEELSSLKILLYLYKYNPDLTVSDIAENTNLSTDETTTILSNLVSDGLVIVKKTEKGRAYSLSEMTRLALDRVQDKDA